MSERIRLSLVAAVGVAGALVAGSAIAQDYDAGKTPPQLFASDCSACHSKPGGLAKGMSRGALASFLKEHYTSKQENAEALAGYLLGAGPGDTKPDKADNPGGPKAKTRKAEREAEPKPRTEPAAHPEDEGENNPDGPKRARAADREAAKGPGEAILSKLSYYGSARGEAKDTARLADPARRLETYANSGSPTIRPPDVAAHDDVAPSAKRKAAEKKKKKKDTDAPVSAATQRPPHPPRPVPAPQGAGNN